MNSSSGTAVEKSRCDSVKQPTVESTRLLQLESRGLIYDASLAPPSRKATAFVSLLRLQSGTLMASFQVGPKKHASNSTIGLCRSVDNGASWQLIGTTFETAWQGVPGSLSIGELAEVAPGKLLLIATWFDRSQPERTLLDPATEGILPSRQLKAFSSDEGQNWSAWEEVPTPGLTGCAATGPILRWRDGTIACAFESFKEYGDPRPIGHGAWLLPSADGGKTFGEPVVVARCPEGGKLVYYFDQRLCIGPRPGEYIGLFWTYDRVHEMELKVHACRGQLNGCRVSDVSIWETNIPGQISAPTLLEDGRWVAITVDRRHPATMKLWISADGGINWPDDQMLLLHTHEERAKISEWGGRVGYEQIWDDMSRWSLGHPAICNLGNGRVLVAYYAGTPECIDVHWARVRVV